MLNAIVYIVHVLPVSDEYDVLPDEHDVLSFFVDNYFINSQIKMAIAGTIICCILVHCTSGLAIYTALTYQFELNAKVFVKWHHLEMAVLKFSQIHIANRSKLSNMVLQG